MTEKISSNGKPITNDSGSVIFKCPNCGDTVISRSTQDRKLATKYKCAKCGFEGPN